MILYLLESVCHGKKCGGRLVIEREGMDDLSVPLNEVETVVISAKGQLSTQAVLALLERGVTFFYVDRMSRIVGTMGGEKRSINRLKVQMASFRDEEKRLSLGRENISEKLMAQRAVLRRYRKSMEASLLEEACHRLSCYVSAARMARSEEALLGIEGNGARVYFSVFPLLLGQTMWDFPGRHQRGAKDPVNALLNYGYAFLEGEVRLAAAASGLDGRVGFLHRDDGRKDSLIYDLMERFRPEVTDRLVLSLLRRQAFAPSDFAMTPQGLRLLPSGRRCFLERYERYMTKPLAERKGLSLRAWIRQELRHFSQALFLEEKKEA